MLDNKDLYLFGWEDGFYGFWPDKDYSWSWHYWYGFNDGEVTIMRMMNIN